MSTTTATVSLDPSWHKIQPLGFYAPPGQPVTITVPDRWVDAGLSIQVGERYDDLRNLGHIESWYRAPMLLRTFPITTATTLVTNTFGGAIYLDVPEGTTGDLELEVSEAYAMTVYTHGESSEGRLGGGANQRRAPNHFARARPCAPGGGNIRRRLGRRPSRGGGLLDAVSPPPHGACARARRAPLREPLDF